MRIMDQNYYYYYYYLWHQCKCNVISQTSKESQLYLVGYFFDKKKLLIEKAREYK